MSPRHRFVLPVLSLLVCAVAHAGDAAPAPVPEGIGVDMGYRMYGDGKKNRPLQVQNSRPTAVQIFQEDKGVYLNIPPYSDAELSCRGAERVLHVRFVDSFGESAPFQLRIACGRELQFIAKSQTVGARPGLVVPPVESVEHPAQSPDVVDSPIEPPVAAPVPPSPTSAPADPAPEPTAP